jgi:hypothetical protein
MIGRLFARKASTNTPVQYCDWASFCRSAFTASKIDTTNKVAAAIRIAPAIC